MNEKAKYYELTEQQKAKIQEIRVMFSAMYDFIEETCLNSRETSLGLTKLEESQFWLIKGISREKSKK